MLLNLIRHKVLSEDFGELHGPPESLRYLPPFLGISINLVRANFHAFGRRSIARVVRSEEGGSALDIACAADVLIQYLFNDFLSALQLLARVQNTHFANWLGVSSTELASVQLVRQTACWSCWGGYYENCHSLDDLLARSSDRLRTWAQFLALLKTTFLRRYFGR